MKIDYKKLAQKYQTPIYVYNFDDIKTRFLSLKEAFKARKSIIFYAVKANSNLSILKLLKDLGSGFDCVSANEIKRALQIKADPYKIIFSGVGKRDDEIEFAIKEKILMINVESLQEYQRVELIANKLNQNVRISVRVNPNIDAKTHPYISTGLNENKFGVDIDTAKQIYIKAKNNPLIDPIGIHFHIGSQLTDLSPIKEASIKVANIVKELKAIEVDIKFFDVGGGIGVSYENEEVIKPYDYSQSIFESLNGLDVTVCCEPGRSLLAHGGVFVTQVLYEKINNDKRFIIVDGAMNDFIRVSLYDMYHEIEILNDNQNSSPASVVGPVCESGDFFAKNRLFPQTSHGDIVLIKDTGAYGFSMSSNYNSRVKVAEIAMTNGKDSIIRDRESFEDLIEHEVKYI